MLDRSQETDASHRHRPHVDSPPAVIRLGLDGVILCVNAGAFDLFGYDPEDMVGRHHSMLVPADHDTSDSVWAALRRGESHIGECRAVCKDGSRILIEATYTPVLDAGGCPQEIVKIARAPATDGLRAADDRGQIIAINTSQAVIHFALDGTITEANALFLNTMGYRLDEVLGQHHRMFVDADYSESADYAAFWAELAKGSFKTAEYKRQAKGGREVWLQATYNPIVGDDGQPFKIVKLATDVTQQKLRLANYEGQIAAIHRSQGVITFDMDGTITEANDLFLTSVGYSRDEVIGRHHRMFLAPDDAESAEYIDFWRELRQGSFKSAEYKRLGKAGREVWLQATYNPILDLNGRPFKVVKFAMDVTAEKLRQADYEGQIAAIHKSQGVITFDMNGTVIDANQRFLDATGYRLDEIEGQHHRMFVDPSYVHGPEYATFWNNLSEGRHEAGEYKRYGKGGREVWLQATYNPIFDLNGRPFKVVKYATVVTREKLRQADLQGQIASIHKAQCVVSLGMDGTILDANHNFLVKTGYRLAAVRGRHHRMFVEADVAESADYAEFWNSLARGQHRASEYKCLCLDGREIWLQATYTPIFDMNGRPFKVVQYATDVTQDKLRQADFLGQIAAIDKSHCMVGFDLDGTIIDANENFLQAMGYDLEEVKGRHHRMFVEPGLAETPHYAEFWDTLRAGSFLSAKFKRIGKNGREVWIQASFNPILDLNGRPIKVIKIATDITADVALAADLGVAKRQAEHDSTTALPNRIRLASFMKSALTTSKARLAVLYLDLDHFKPINDSFGHHVGDHVLSETAARLRRILRQDQMVARIGGDEFVVAAPNLTDEEIETLCRRLINVVTSPIRHEKGMLSVGLSIGVAISPADAATPDDLLRCADVALYRAKGEGRGQYRYYAGKANERLAATRHLAEDMSHGIKADQFFLEYQPRFHSQTRLVQSVEALVRWSHPERGRIEPSDFLPLAEKSGLIVPLGAWILRSACQTVQTWPGLGVSVNVSPVQFRSSDLIETVETILSETGLEPARLELEINEGALIEDEERARATLDALSARGVRLALVAFGPGYGSQNHLRTFPFNVIKIDRKLIADPEAKDAVREFVRSILDLGKTVGISIAADGTETAGQLHRLGLDDCPDVQGLLLTPPMSADQISALLANIDPPFVIDSSPPPLEQMDGASSLAVGRTA